MTYFMVFVGHVHTQIEVALNQKLQSGQMVTPPRIRLMYSALHLHQTAQAINVPIKSKRHGKRFFALSQCGACSELEQFCEIGQDRSLKNSESHVSEMLMSLN